MLIDSEQKQYFVINNKNVSYKRPTSKVFSGEYLPSGVVKQDLETSKRQNELDDAYENGISFGGKKTQKKTKRKRLKN